jgi:hypothetical protein
MQLIVSQWFWFANSNAALNLNVFYTFKNYFSAIQADNKTVLTAARGIITLASAEFGYGAMVHIAVIEVFAGHTPYKGIVAGTGPRVDGPVG